MHFILQYLYIFATEIAKIEDLEIYNVEDCAVKSMFILKKNLI